MIARWVYCRQLDRYVDMETGELCGTTVFNSMNTRVARFGATGEKSAVAIFQNHPAARKVRCATYRPGKPVITDELIAGAWQPAVNLWRPSILKPAENVTDADVAPWLHLAVLLFGDRGGPAAKHILDYMAFLVQHQGKKVNHPPVILGEEGIGKDTVFEPLRRALGAHNCATIGPELLTTPFNSGWIDKQCLVINEAHTFHRRETMNVLKPIIAVPPDTLSVNRKNVPHYTIPNIINVVLFTNHDDALAPTKGGRRYWIHRCLIEKKPDMSYFTALWDWINSGGDAKVFGWLMQRYISAFDSKEPAPMTEGQAGHDQTSPIRTRAVALRSIHGGRNIRRPQSRHA
jgi:hypothetical protein